MALDQDSIQLPMGTDSWVPFSLALCSLSCTQSPRELPSLLPFLLSFLSPSSWAQGLGWGADLSWMTVLSHTPSTLWILEMPSTTKLHPQPSLYYLL